MDYSFLQDVIPQNKEEKQGNGMSNVTVRVDADCYLQCDGEYVDVKIVEDTPVKVSLPAGQHLLEFISAINPNIKVEKIVDFHESGKNYLVLVNELKARVSPSITDISNHTAVPSNPYLDQLSNMQSYNPLDGFCDNIAGVHRQVPVKNLSEGDK